MSVQPDGKIEFCRKARQMIDEEESGRQDYSELINYGEDWRAATDEKQGTELNSILRTLDAIRLQEEVHQGRLRAIVEGHCENVGLE